jgi:hypothetical protein
MDIHLDPSPPTHTHWASSESEIFQSGALTCPLELIHVRSFLVHRSPDPQTLPRLLFLFSFVFFLFILFITSYRDKLPLSAASVIVARRGLDAPLPRPSRARLLIGLS